MELRQYFIAKVYRRKEPVPYQLDNGNKGVTYPVIIDNMEDTEVLKVTEDVYNRVQDGKHYLFLTSINTSYQRKEVRIVDIMCELPDGGISTAQLGQIVRTVAFGPEADANKQKPAK